MNELKHLNLRTYKYNHALSVKNKCARRLYGTVMKKYQIVYVSDDDGDVLFPSTVLQNEV